MVNFLRYCIFGILSFSVLTAHAARTVVVQPGELLPTYGPGIGPDAFIDSRDWNATISDQKGTRHSVPVVREKKYSWPTFRGSLKNALKVNPGQLALTGVITGALAGVDYIFDNSGAIPVLSKKDQPDSVFGYPFINSSSFTGSCNGIDSFSQGFHSSGPGNYQYVISDPAYTANGFQYVNNCGPGYRVSQRSYAPFDVTPGTVTPVTDSELDHFLSGINNPSDAVALAPVIESSVPGSFDYPDSETFGGPNSIDLPGEVTTTTNPATGDTTVVESLPSLQLDYGTSPLSITSTQTTVTNTYQNGTQTSTSVSTETNTSIETPVADIPTDCDFMPTVCSFIDWVKTPFNEEEPDLSEFISDEDFEREINFSSNASCPGPSMIATSHGTYEFSWEPACQWAGMVKPLVIIAALIAAIFINLGMARGNE